jgi:hypothetical protein
MDGNEYEDDLFALDDDYRDCYLSPEEANELLDSTSASRFKGYVVKFKDIDPSLASTRFTVDRCKTFVWEKARAELRQICRRFDQEADHDGAFETIFGENCPFMRCLMDVSGLNYVDLRRFLGTLCIQSAYAVSSTELYCDDSLLKAYALMKNQEYNATWEIIGLSKRCKGVSRRDTTNWMIMETTLNQILRSISISDREDSSILLTHDDDKVWASNTGSNADDRFGLKYTQHVRDNRKGIVVHTAVSSTTSLPLGISFERENESIALSFRRIMDYLFSTGINRLRDVIVHCDRGYLLPSLVYDDV